MVEQHGNVVYVTTALASAVIICDSVTDADECAKYWRRVLSAVWN